MSANDRILVTLDGSPAAYTAARAAIQIAQARSLSIYGLFIIDEALLLNPYADFGRELGEMNDELSRDHLLAIFKARGSKVLLNLEDQCRVANVPVQAELLLGGVTELILREAEQSEMLSLGRRGGTDHQQSDHLGHNFRYIAHHARCPIIVGGDSRCGSMKRLLLPYDDDGHGRCAEERAVEWAVLLQRALPSDVLVLAMQHQDERPLRWETGIKACLNRGGLQNYNLVIRTGVTASAITAVSITHHADLVIMARYQHSAFLEWLTGSTVDTILRNSALPVLMV